MHGDKFGRYSYSLEEQPEGVSIQGVKGGFQVNICREQGLVKHASLLCEYSEGKDTVCSRSSWCEAGLLSTTLGEKDGLNALENKGSNHFGWHREQCNWAVVGGTASVALVFVEGKDEPKS